MIKLTDEQLDELKTPEGTPPRMVNPRTNETFILLPVSEYERLKADEYDDSPWSRDEIQALAWEAGERGDWDEYDDAEKL
jgi:hypothetical protein